MDNIYEEVALALEDMYIKTKESYPFVDNVHQMPKDVRKVYLDCISLVRDLGRANAKSA